MKLDPQEQLIYLITSGATTFLTTPTTEDFAAVLSLVQAAVDSRVDLLQIREKNLSARVLYNLSASAAGITKGSATKLLVNDRSDIAAAAGADGVHLATSSLATDVVRSTFGSEFLIGVSTHSLEEAAVARQRGADFAVFGPVFETASKRDYGEAMGLRSLEKVTAELAPFPVLALGGININNVADCIHSGARGVAAIRMLNDPNTLAHVVDKIRAEYSRARD